MLFNNLQSSIQICTVSHIVQALCNTFLWYNYATTANHTLPRERWRRETTSFPWLWSTSTWTQHSCTMWATTHVPLYKHVHIYSQLVQWRVQHRKNMTHHKYTSNIPLHATNEALYKYIDVYTASYWWARAPIAFALRPSLSSSTLSRPPHRRILLLQ